MSRDRRIPAAAASINSICYDTIILLGYSHRYYEQLLARARGGVSLFSPGPSPEASGR